MGYQLHMDGEGMLAIDSLQGSRGFLLTTEKFQYKNPAPYTLSPSGLIRSNRMFETMFPGCTIPVQASQVKMLNAVNQQMRRNSGHSVVEVRQGKRVVGTLNALDLPGGMLPLDPGKQYQVLSYDIRLGALLDVYNADSIRHERLRDTWNELNTLCAGNYRVREEALQQLVMLATDGHYKEYNKKDDRRLYDLVLNIKRTALSNQEKAHDLNTDQIIHYLADWSWVQGQLTLTPLGICDTLFSLGLTDTIYVLQQISQIDKQLSLPLAMDERIRNYKNVQLINYRQQLERLRSYTVQMRASAAMQRGFTPYSAIANIAVPDQADYQIIRNASDNFRLYNQNITKAEILNKESVALYVYNIPQGKKLGIEIKDSAIKVDDLQFNRIITPLLDALKLGSGSPSPFEFANYKAPKTSDPNSANSSKDAIDAPTNPPGSATAKVFNPLEILLQAIGIADATDAMVLPLIQTLPPARKIAVTALPQDNAVKTEAKSVEQKDQQYSHIYQYKLWLDTNKSVAKDFQLRTYRLARIQFTGAVHFLTGSAPEVHYENNQFVLRSDDHAHFSVGVKYYLQPQTFSDVSFHQAFSQIHRHVFIHTGLDLNRPLDFFYPSIGFDMIPGLAVSVGGQIYRYSRYQIVNGVEVAEQKTYEMRKGATVNILMDASLITRIFTSMLKL